jgi:hypothetical protein
MAQKKIVRCVFLFYLFFFFRGIFTPVGGREREKPQKKDELPQKKDELPQKKDELPQKIYFVVFVVIIALF